MAEELQSTKDISSISDSIESVPVASRDTITIEDSEVPILHPIDLATADSRSGTKIQKNSEQNNISACTTGSAIPVGNDLHRPGPSPSAFRPFITQTSQSSTSHISSSSQNQATIISTPISKHSSKLTLPEIESFSTLHKTLQLSSPNHQGFLGEAGSNNDDNEDGRTTASAPPCTPAPEPHQQPQSPFRNSRQIKKIDLLAMSRSRQSDRAENVRRDGRLAPSPRKKDEVLRNNGFTFPAGRGFRTYSSLQMSLHNNSLASSETRVSPERLISGTSLTESPNVDVVSVDDQPDPSKYTFSIQFHDFTPAEHMMKCNLCGFVTNNQKFYKRHKRLHNRQHQPTLIHCNFCDYSTTHVRKIREHTITSHHLPHSHSFTSSSQSSTLPTTFSESSQKPLLQGQMYISTGNILHPATSRQDTATSLSSASILGLQSYIPTPQEHHIQVNNQADLQHPPRGNAMLGNYATTNEQQLTSYMRSMISNLMSPPQIYPNSSVTSSDYSQAARNLPYGSHTVLPASNNPNIEGSDSTKRLWNSNSYVNNRNNTSESGSIRVKKKSVTTPASIVPRSVHCVSSRAHRGRSTSSPQSRRQSDTLDSESGMDMSSDDHTSSPQPRTDARISTETNLTDNTTLLDEPTQFPVPFIKIEFPPHRESCSYLSHSARSDCGVQCEIISTSGLSNRQGHMQSETVSSADGSSCVETRCHFCGVTFDDEVLYSIHLGCHSHTDPFVCNVCGKQCHNKYGFYSHIMRGHLARSNT